MTEKEKMLAGELYHPGDPELAAGRERCEGLLRGVNDRGDVAALQELLGAVGAGTTVRSPFHCD
ncbi:MAG: maltose O-acetyltransferase, partial [Thermoleophilaceae bacterium]|nr:maltose O-acetyltransferase [Thermoleophilaceae bacterium]